MNDILQQVRPLIAGHEGLRLTPYHCTGNKLTIGYGRNLDTVLDDGDKIVIKPTDSEVDKLVNALLAEAEQFEAA